MQKFNLNQSQILKQEQTLTALQIQSLDLLMAPVLELQAKINHELETNPILEVEQEEPTDLKESFTGAEEEPDETKESREEKILLETGKIEAEYLSEDDSETVFEKNDMLVSSGNSSNSSMSIDEEKREHFFNSIIDKQSIEDDLNFQLSFLNINDEQKRQCELIIGCLDEQGFFRSSLADLAIIAGADIEDMEKALTMVKSLDPSGVGARNIKECLLLQLEREVSDNIDLKNMVEHHLEDIAANRLPKIAKALHIGIDEVKNAIIEIKKLNPYPYAKIQNEEESLFIVPEVKIKKENGCYVVIVDKEYQPRLKLSGKYINMLQNPSLSKETRDYIKEKILSANNIIKGMEQRQSTIKKIADVIVDTQYDFMENGIFCLKPLTMKHVADKIGVHETTVGRAVANKYAETPQGVFPLKYFFSTGFQLADGELVASKGVMERIRNIIDSEDSTSPYSDDDISKILNESGIPVARRTVAKYREAMNIPSSRLRKEHA